MSNPVAKKGDQVTGVDTHIVLIPSPAGPVPTPVPCPFNGILVEALAGSVFVDHCAVAVEGSVGKNVPPHIPAGGPFQRPPSNRATVKSGSSTVFAEARAVARLGDPAVSCNDPTDAATSHVLAAATVFAG